MIQSKEDLIRYLEEDRNAYHKEKPVGMKAILSSMIYHDYNYEFMRNLRKWEYHINTGGGTPVLLYMAV